MVYQHWRHSLGLFSQVKLRSGAEIFSNKTFCSFPPKCHKCGALIVNFRQPSFVMVNCKHNITCFVLCSMNPFERTKANDLRIFAALNDSSKGQFCPPGLIKNNMSCFQFSVLGGQTVSCFLAFERLRFLFDCVNAVFPPLLTDNQTFVTFKRYLNRYNFTFNEVPDNFSQGICIKCQWLMTLLTFHGNVIQCQSQVFLSVYFLHDKVNDCPGDDKSDEVECEYNHADSNTKYCQKWTNLDGVKGCSNLFYKAHNGECSPYILHGRSAVIKTKKNQFDPKKENFICQNGNKLSQDLMNDLTADCLPHGDDENDLRSLIELHTTHQCFFKHQIACRPGHTKCYNISEICSYVLNEMELLFPCRTGEHLWNCQTFQCNAMYKCIANYCISWRYVCDGKWDCPIGTDEFVDSHFCETLQKCVKLFKCKLFQICIHFQEVCDGKNDCPLGDDEALCTLLSLSCPSGCNCLTFAVHCKNVSNMNTMFVVTLHFEIISMENTDVFSKTSARFAKALVFSLKQSKVHDVCNLMLFCESTREITIAFTNLKELRLDCFGLAVKLLKLDLSNNQITTLSGPTFSKLSNLMTLNLTSNPIQTMSSDTFSNLTNLRVLSLLNLTLAETDSSLLEQLNATFVETGRYQVCCLAPLTTQCTSQIPWNVSCTGLLPNRPIKVSYFCVSVGVVVINLPSFALHRISHRTGEKQKAAFALIVCSANIADILGAIPLCILWISDFVFQRNFILVEEKWRQSTLCFVVFGLLLYFNFVSPSIFCLSSLSRLMVVLHPVDTKFKSKSFILKCVLMVIVSSAVLSIILTSLTWLLNTFLSSNILTSLCSPFVDPSKTSIMVKITTWLTILFQLCSTIFVFIAYVWMLLSLNKSQKKLSGHVSSKRSNIPVIVQVVILTLSNTISWVPCAAVYLVCMFLEQYPVEMVTWVAGAVAPVNSILRPIVMVVSEVRTLRK